jgi:type II secretory pathway component GspD/PulD (secretin)
MNLKSDESARRRINRVPLFVGLALALAILATCAGAQTQSADPKPAEPKPGPETYQTLYLTNLTQERDYRDILNDLRNMLPKAKVYYVESQGAISVLASPSDILLAQKILADLDRTRKTYRLTYTITETDNGRPVGARHYSLIVVSGQKTVLKQGSRVPIVTGTTEAGSSAQNTQVQYVDVGTSIEASMEAYSDGLRLQTKVEQSSLAEEKSGMGAQDPVIRQSTLDGTTTLTQGKPLVLGSLDVQGSTRKQEIEVVAELVGKDEKTAKLVR